MAYPLLPPTISFIFGLIFSLTAKIKFSSWFVLAFIVILMANWVLYFLKKENLSRIFLLIGFFSAGFILYSWEFQNFQLNPLHQLKAEGYLEFQGKILKSPERRPDRDLLTIEINQVEMGREIKKMRGRLRLSVPHSTTSEKPLEFLAGDEVDFSASLNSPESFRNFFPDFMPRYLRCQKIDTRAYTKSPFLIRKLNSSNQTISGFFSGLRRSLQKKIEADFPGKEKNTLSTEGAILEALLLGEDGRIDHNTDLQFQKTGLYHLLAISGAHVGVVAFLTYFLLGLIIIRRKTINFIMLLALIFYAFLVEGQPSVFRAVIMASLFFLGKIIFAEVNFLNTISLSALILLLINPFSLEDVGFQLTFLATLSLILFYQPILKWLPPLPLKLSEMMALSVAAVAGTMPIIVSNFNRVTFAPVILNLPAAPLVSLIMGAGYLYLIIASVLSAAGHFFSFALKLLVKLLLWVITWLEPFSSLSYRLPSPPLAIILGFYSFLLLFLLKSKFRGQKLLTAAGFMIFFLILITYPFSPTNSNLTVSFLDVGQGDSAVIELPGGKVVVVDAGGFPHSSFDTGESIVSPFLWHKGYKKIDYLICTHLHPDHAGGISALARNFKIKEYWYSENDPHNYLQQEIQKALSPKVAKRKVLTGLRINEGLAEIEAFFPDLQAFLRFQPGNDRSAVLRLNYGQQSFLLAADITREVEKYILTQNKGSLRSTVLKVPHHGSRSSSSPDFIEEISPQWAVITAGRNNIYGFPDAEVISTLEAKGVRILRIDRDGAIEFKSDGHNLSLRTAAGSAGLE